MKRIIVVGFLILVAAVAARFALSPRSVELYTLVPPPPPVPLDFANPPDSLSDTEARIYRTHVSEELIKILAPQLQALAASFGEGERDFTKTMMDKVRYAGIQDLDIEELLSGSEVDWTHKGHLSQSFKWPLDETDAEVEPAKVLDPLLRKHRWTEAQFGILDGTLLEDGKRFEMLTSLEAQSSDAENGVFGIKATQKLTWRKEETAWRIQEWKQQECKITRATNALFADVTAEAIADPTTQAAINRSPHIEMLLREAAGKDYPQKSRPTFKHFNDWHSSAVYPSVSVVDFDNDGFEDLFLTGKWERSYLLRNLGDGTFVDVSADSGLALENAYTNCALFADFDNDGDSDALLGRTPEASLFYRNENGHFVLDESATKELVDCKFISAGSVIDVNRDGLLDVYLCTYCSYAATSMDWIKYAVPEELALKLEANVWRRHSFLDRGGPPNILLINDAGTLKPSEVEAPHDAWRNSFQPVWIDYDSDGDSDLYVCNDFSPDLLLRNETERGSSEPAFTDVTKEVFGDRSMGFGMGASVGDYNSDGQLDLYVSNMYSKAGNRVFQQVGTDVSPEVKVAAQGNFLYEKDGTQFTQVAGTEVSKQHVSKVGWSFGGQFQDFDNDGQLDVYVPSGLFTAPEEIRRNDDL